MRGVDDAAVPHAPSGTDEARDGVPDPSGRGGPAAGPWTDEEERNADPQAPPAGGEGGPGRAGAGDAGDVAASPAGAPSAAPRVRAAAGHTGRGVLMGAADLVPGVSGGTVALILGIHPRLVAAIASFDARLPADLWAALRRDADARARLRRLDLWFLIPLALGIGAAILAGAHAVSAAIEARPDLAMALFFGLLIGSVPVAWRHAKGRRVLVPALLGTALAGALVFLPGGAWPTHIPGLVAAGAIAITAMILPGVSGSGLLVLIGAYEALLAAVSALDVAFLAPFAVGALIGLAAASRILTWLFRHRPAPTWAFLTGLVVGSLARVWPWRTEAGFGLGLPALPPLEAGALLLVAAGAVGYLAVRLLDAAGARGLGPQKG